MPGRETVIPACGCALLVAVCVRLAGWPAWASAATWLILWGVFISTEIRPPE